MRGYTEAFAAGVLAAGILFFAGCAREEDGVGPPIPAGAGDRGDAAGEETARTDEEAAETNDDGEGADEEEVEGDEEDVAEAVFEISADDNMRFGLTAFEVAPGQTVTVVLENVGEMPVEAMGHNFVLLDLGTDPNAFARDAVQYPGNAYIPPEREDEVIVATAILGPGEREEITFVAPERSGEYDYICSFPGHTAAGMVGVMTVRAEEPEEPEEAGEETEEAPGPESDTEEEEPEAEEDAEEGEDPEEDEPEEDDEG